MDEVDSALKQMLSRAVALVRGHPLLTPLLIVYATVNLIAAIFAFGPSHFPIDLVLLAAYISVIHFATTFVEASACSEVSKRPSELRMPLPASMR